MDRGVGFRGVRGGRLTENNPWGALPLIDYELTYDGLEAAVTQAHIHFGQFFVSGGISVFLCNTEGFPDPSGLAPTYPQSGTVTGTITAENVIGLGVQGIAAGEFAELLTAIRSGVSYANVHSAKFP